MGLAQPSIFVSLGLIRKLGYLREDLEIIFDTNLYISAILLLGPKLKNVILPFVLSGCLTHAQAKTSRCDCLVRLPLEKELIFQEIKQKLSWRNRFSFALYLEEVKLEQLICDMPIAEKPSFRKIIRIPLFHPRAYFSRFFWGALRKSIF
jgi:hypothetical protein